MDRTFHITESVAQMHPFGNLDLSRLAWKLIVCVYRFSEVLVHHILDLADLLGRLLDQLVSSQLYRFRVQYWLVGGTRIWNYGAILIWT